MENKKIIEITKEITAETGIKEKVVKILLIKNKEYGYSYEKTKKILKGAIEGAVEKRM